MEEAFLRRSSYKPCKKALLKALASLRRPDEQVLLKRQYEASLIQQAFSRKPYQRPYEANRIKEASIHDDYVYIDTSFKL